MKIDMSFIPDGISGDWSIQSFEVKKDDLSQKISYLKTGRGVPEGKYKRLMRSRTCVMSNTPDEIRDFSYFLHLAKGSILINGLGMGCLVKALLEKEEVTSITVIEKSEDVINLVKPYFNDKRLNIIHDDAFTYKNPKDVKYDYVWHDIWDYICSDNLKEMKKLHRKYGKKVNFFQDSWCKDECKKLKLRDNRYKY